MSKLISIITINILKIVKDKKMVLFLIAFPLVFTFIFGNAFGEESETGVPIVVADLDKSSFSKALINKLKENEKSIKLNRANQEEAINSVKDKSNQLAILIPNGFGKDIQENRRTRLRTITLPNSNSAVALKEILAGILYRMEANASAATETVGLLVKQKKLNPDQMQVTWDNVYKEADKKWAPEPPMKVKYQELSGKDITKTDYNGMTHFSLGFSVAFVMFTLTFGAGGILEEKEKGTWGRLLTTPTRPWLILTGHLVSTFIIGWLQVAILILAGQFLFGVDWGSNISALIILMSVYLFAITGFGLMLSGFVSTHAQLQATAQIILPAFAMLGGAYWPLDIVPKTMQIIANFIPTGQAMKGLLDMVVRGKGLVEIQQPIYILLLMGIICFAIGIKRVKLE